MLGSNEKLNEVVVNNQFFLPFCLLGHHPLDDSISAISGEQDWCLRSFFCDEAVISE